MTTCGYIPLCRATEMDVIYLLQKPLLSPRGYPAQSWIASPFGTHSSFPPVLPVLPQVYTPLPGFISAIKEQPPLLAQLRRGGVKGKGERSIAQGAYSTPALLTAPIPPPAGGLLEETPPHVPQALSFLTCRVSCLWRQLHVPLPGTGEFAFS